MKSKKVYRLKCDLFLEVPVSGTKALIALARKQYSKREPAWDIDTGKELTPEEYIPDLQTAAHEVLQFSVEAEGEETFEISSSSMGSPQLSAPLHELSPKKREKLMKELD